MPFHLAGEHLLAEVALRPEEGHVAVVALPHLVVQFRQFRMAGVHREHRQPGQADPQAAPAPAVAHIDLPHLAGAHVAGPIPLPLVGGQPDPAPAGGEGAPHLPVQGLGQAVGVRLGVVGQFGPVPQKGAVVPRLPRQRGDGGHPAAVGQRRAQQAGGRLTRPEESDARQRQQTDRQHQRPHPPFQGRARAAPEPCFVCETHSIHTLRPVIRPPHGPIKPGRPGFAPPASPRLFFSQ